MIRTCFVPLRRCVRFYFLICMTFVCNDWFLLQIEEEIAAIFDFMKHVYGIFGFEFHLELSTRPEKYLGAIETWNAAEEVIFCFLRDSPASTFITHAHHTQQLKTALETFYPGKWEVNAGDGAFYGPKIDITIRDALKRSFQCATIQLDFQLPERFNLKYRAADDNDQLGDKEKAPSRPVMIHRAILGSLERFIAIVTEHFGGKWPFWLSPRQVLVVPVAAPYVRPVFPFFSPFCACVLIFCCVLKAKLCL